VKPEFVFVPRERERFLEVFRARVELVSSVHRVEFVFFYLASCNATVLRCSSSIIFCYLSRTETGKTFGFTSDELCGDKVK